MELAPEDKIERVANDLREKLKKDKNHLKTGFVGTPYFCKVLSENGCNDLAYTLLLNKDYPSWLYAVTMGATTIWERWNSVLPDGKISGTDMNSLNHYAYGSIAEWMYRYVAGINPVEDKPGFRHIKLTPMPDYRLKYAKATYNSTVGVYESQWEITEEGNLSFKFVIPFNASATLVLPDAKLENVKVNGKTLKDTELKSNQSNKNVAVELTSGSYEFDYLPEVAYIKYYGIDVNLDELVANEEVKDIVGEKLPMIIAEDMLERSGHQSLRELSFMPFSPITNDLLEELDKKLGEIKVSVI
jgi:alpha-L-rhamnosidase